MIKSDPFEAIVSKYTFNVVCRIPEVKAQQQNSEQFIIWLKVFDAVLRAGAETLTIDLTRPDGASFLHLLLPFYLPLFQVCIYIQCNELTEYV